MDVYLRKALEILNFSVYTENILFCEWVFIYLEVYWEEVMKKLMSLLLSCLLIFSACAPDTDLGPVSFDKVDLSSLGKEVMAVVDALEKESSEEGPVSLEEFRKLYESFKSEECNQQRAQADDNAVFEQNAQCASSMGETAIRQAYETYKSRDQKFMTQATQEYLSDLAKEIYDYYSGHPQEGLMMIEKAYPLFQLYGALPDNLRTSAAGILRKEIKATAHRCDTDFFDIDTLKGFANEVINNDALESSIQQDMEDDAMVCERAVLAVQALGALGETQADVDAIIDVFEIGHNGHSAGLVVPTVISALLGMGRLTDVEKVIEIAVSSTQPSGSDILGAYSFEEWFKLFTSPKSDAIWGGKQAYSYYYDEKSGGGNLWFDVADELAYIMRFEKESDDVKAMLQNIAPKLIFNSGNEIEIRLAPFLAGLLNNGVLRIQIEGERSDDSVVKVTLKVPEAVRKVLLQKTQAPDGHGHGWSFTATVIYALFMSPKNSLQPAYQFFLSEKLCEAFETEALRLYPGFGTFADNMVPAEMNDFLNDKNGYINRITAEAKDYAMQSLGWHKIDIVLLLVVSPKIIAGVFKGGAWALGGLEGLGRSGVLFTARIIKQMRAASWARFNLVANFPKVFKGGVRIKAGSRAFRQYFNKLIQNIARKMGKRSSTKPKDISTGTGTAGDAALTGADDAALTGADDAIRGADDGAGSVSGTGKGAPGEGKGSGVGDGADAGVGDGAGKGTNAGDGVGTGKGKTSGSDLADGTDAADGTDLTDPEADPSATSGKKSKGGSNDVNSKKIKDEGDAAKREQDRQRQQAADEKSMEKKANSMGVSLSVWKRLTVNSQELWGRVWQQLQDFLNEFPVRSGIEPAESTQEALDRKSVV